MRVFTFFLLLIPLIAISGCQHDHKKIVKTHTLSAKQQKRISFKSDRETTVSFNADLSDADRAKIINGFRVSYVDATGRGEALTSKTNLHITAPPEDGKITLRVENLESIPIKLFVSWKEDIVH